MHLILSSNKSYEYGNPFNWCVYNVQVDNNDTKEHLIHDNLIIRKSVINPYRIETNLCKLSLKENHEFINHALDITCKNFLRYKNLIYVNIKQDLKLYDFIKM